MSPTMRAAVLRTAELPRPYTDSRPLSLETIPVPEPRAGEVLVRITRASLCHSDLSVINGSRVRPLPMALGHEATGVVDRVGDGVEDVRPGDHVVLVFVPACGSCRACSAGRPALCYRGAESNASGDLLHGPSLLSSTDGERINHHLGVSAFTDYAVVARESVVVIDDDVPFDVAAMFGCAALTGIGAVLNTAAVQPGQTVVVFGIGAVGLMAVMAAAKVAGARVIAIDPLPTKQELGLRCGAELAGGPDDAARLVGQVSAEGADVVIEAVGSSRVIEAGLDLLARGGAVVPVGLPRPDQRMDLQALQFAGMGRRILGSYMGDAVPERDIPAYLDLWRQGTLPVELLHTDTRPLVDLNESLDALADGLVVRRIFTLD